MSRLPLIDLNGIFMSKDGSSMAIKKSICNIENLCLLRGFYFSSEEKRSLVMFWQKKSYSRLKLKSMHGKTHSNQLMRELRTF